MANATKVAPIKVEVTGEMIRFWVNHKMNVLLIGRHGIGKSQMVMSEWEEIYGEEGKDWKYLSASTLDPWVDFVGIPQASEDTGDGKTIEFIRPKWLETVKAIFIDELNRSHPKIRNALMEAIQFHSINGMPLGNLEMVWAAVNPTDEEDEDFHYDTDELDAATRDRFPIQIYLKEEPNLKYFTMVFGSEVASAAVSWWKSLKSNLPDAVKLISPRRLEMLVTYIQGGGEGRHIIPDAIAAGARVKSLIQEIRSRSPLRQEMKVIHRSQDAVAATAFIKDETHYDACIGEIMGHGEMRKFWIPCMPSEKIAVLFSANSTVQNLVIGSLAKHKSFREVALDIHKTTSDSTLRARIAGALGVNDLGGATSDSGTTENPNATVEPGNPTSTENNLLAAIGQSEQKATSQGLNDTWSRQKAFADMKARMPQTPISKGTVLRALWVMEKHLVGRAQTNALARKDVAGARWNGVLAVTNRFLSDLSETDYDMTDFHKSYPSLWKYCLLRKDNFLFLIA